MPLFSFLPKTVNFTDLFSQAGTNAARTSEALVDLLANYTDVEAKVRRIRDLEHEGDRLSRDIAGALTTTFITPFDREDIIELNNHLDDFVDFMEDVARRMWLYRIARPTAQAVALGAVVARQAELLARALPLLEDKKRTSDLMEFTRQVKELEDEGDRLLDEVQVAIYDGVTAIPDLVAAMRWNELYTLLEDATDQAQRVANTIEGILLKHA
ncbi:DUF47 domain-containing protein [Deinococcus pimensis]|uniref:DUF47 domain-containing protein n=1 Tax=Deinococcus pimensis TaxID=309888 RepID=UPI000486DA89|nr:DUF47 domain-containing protein [Deinococcus pimensis]